MKKSSTLTPFGKLVKIKLLEMDMDARDLAKMIGTNPVQISRILHGKRPGHGQVKQIARILDIPIENEQGA